MAKQIATYIGVSLVILLVVGLLVFMGMTIAARLECHALGFEYGRWVLWPDFEAVCQYQLDMPLREVRPHLTD